MKFAGSLIKFSVADLLPIEKGAKLNGTGKKTRGNIMSIINNAIVTKRNMLG